MSPFTCMIHAGMALCFHGQVPGTAHDYGNPCDAALAHIVEVQDLATIAGGRDIPGMDEAIGKAFKAAGKAANEACGVTQPQYNVPPAGIPTLHVPGSA